MVKKWGFKKIVLEMQKIKGAMGSFKEAEAKGIFTNEDRNNFYIGHHPLNMKRADYELLLDRLQEGIEKYYSDFKPVSAIKQTELF